MVGNNNNNNINIFSVSILCAKVSVFEAVPVISTPLLSQS